MNQPDPFFPTIAWRCGFDSQQREPVEIDIQDGRAEYLLSGPHRMTEGSKIEVVGGKVLWTGGRSKPS
ncbi:hypothetical protein [Pseudomonas coronafaciens]|uniref:Uncharacterized protein n=1 Tax=Pseudomonas coronafaciens pv. coronafaciens TaxID=235275 RepID=A0AAE6QF55_9PSED|nr:hypothetical protein [Pseudomonas coronafaciens]QGT81601.1 hypothetical protein GMO17_10580 [Pseudomonas coronafaciens pv. coronafaciens]QIQ74485.1 hypothetical protein HBB04_04905 [Pseudomonas coronafaciens]